MNPYDYDDEPEEQRDEYDIEVVDAPDGSRDWEVRVHPYCGPGPDDWAEECWYDDGYFLSLDVALAELKGEAL